MDIIFWEEFFGELKRLLDRVNPPGGTLVTTRYFYRKSESKK